MSLSKHVASHVVTAVLSFGVVMFGHVMLGELLPKNISIARAERVCLQIARPLHIAFRILHPLVMLFSSVARWAAKALGQHEGSESPMSEQELRQLLRASHAGGVVTATEAQIIHKAFEFADQTAADLMIPTQSVAYLSLSRSVEENIAVALHTLHTRLPLCQDDLQSVIGIVNMKDAWPVLRQARSSDVLRQVSRPVPWIDVKMTQDQILRRLQMARSHMGCVRDGTAGAVLGILTLEEILESLLGDVREGTVPRSQTR